MRICAALCAAVALALVVSACGSDDKSDSAPAVRPPAKVASPGPFLGECGQATDDEVRDIGQLGQVSRTFKNSVGCQWQRAGAGSASVTFASYRGSPIDRERAWVTAQGRSPENIQVAGHPGFKDVSPDGTICDLAVQLDDDFFEWSTYSGLLGSRGGDPCAKNRTLAELTVQRSK